MIDKLVELQIIDTKLKDINDLLGDLPSRVKELDHQEDTIKGNLEKSQIRLKEIKVKLHKAEGGIVEINVKINKYKDQLFYNMDKHCLCNQQILRIYSFYF